LAESIHYSVLHPEADEHTVVHGFMENLSTNGKIASGVQNLLPGISPDLLIYMIWMICLELRQLIEHRGGGSEAEVELNGIFQTAFPKESGVKCGMRSPSIGSELLFQDMRQPSLAADPYGGLLTEKGHGAKLGKRLFPFPLP